MNTLNINLNNCYGIKSLETTFNFGTKSTYIIYAPNGTMKTSFANTLKDFSESNPSIDSIFPQRDSSRSITNENGDELAPEEVFVIVPYNQGYKSDRISTLLVNKELKERYDEIHQSINAKKELLINELKTASGLKADAVEKVLSTDFTPYEDRFLIAINRVKTEVEETENPVFCDINYSKVFTDKSTGFLETPQFKEKLDEYVNKYNALVDASTYFQKGVFNHNNASAIAKNLQENGFFEARHSLTLHGDVESENKNIDTLEELTKVIQEEMDSILNNDELRTTFKKIDIALSKNQDLRNFRDYVLAEPKILPELNNIKGFKEKLWISYLSDNKHLVSDLEAEYSKGKEEIDAIVKQAEKEETEWRSVIDEFNKRFTVPFKLRVKNQEDVILKSRTPSIKFEFIDQDGQCEVDESHLYKVLSNGERRALYILNILFEVHARMKDNQPTVFVIDDIADSFDYKNKYAIVEYLQEISRVPLFKQIILTHNYDFFRTLSSRLDMGRQHKLNSVRTEGKIILIEDVYQNNPFSYWKNNLDNKGMLIASIPFVRNLFEYTGDTVNFNKLTSLLHVKSDTRTLKVSDLEIIYTEILKSTNPLALPNQEKLVIDLIFEESDRISQTTDEVLRLEDKIVIAIGIRLRAESYMIDKINDQSFVDAIEKVQTRKLFDRYKELFSQDSESIKVLDKVNLMTPENIHLNSFMYEPILDMGNNHLRDLFKELETLS